MTREKQIKIHKDTQGERERQGEKEIKTIEMKDTVAHASDFFSLKLPNCGLILFMP